MLVATSQQVPQTPPVHRAACTATEIRRAQGRFRDAIVDFLGKPSSLTFGTMHREGLEYLEFERDQLLPSAGRREINDEQYDELLEGHFDLVRGVNTIAADTPGTEELRVDANRLRHTLLQQVDLCERTVCRGRPLRLDP
jgi:hypothetical protein